MPIGKDHQWFYFTRDSITANAPNASGVYALFKDGQWIYFGESNDIQRRLLEHLTQAGTCILQNAPTGFQFELVVADQRVVRQNHWIAGNATPCNQRLG